MKLRRCRVWYFFHSNPLPLLLKWTGPLFEFSPFKTKITSLPLFRPFSNFLSLPFIKGNLQAMVMMIMKFKFALVQGTPYYHSAKCVFRKPPTLPWWIDQKGTAYSPQRLVIHWKGEGSGEWMRYISFKESVLVQEASLGLCLESSYIYVIKTRCK